MSDINSYIASVKNRVDLYIEQYYAKRRDRIPERLLEVLSYAIFPGGKMLRPALLCGMCEEMGSDSSMALPVAGAVELIHTFSLVHDDLPCMDNDDYRRGRETVHKRYSEGLALLSGDAMLADAFGIIASSVELGDNIKNRIVGLVSEYIGSSGMIGGQVLDIEYQMGKRPADIDRIIRLKTANMFILSVLSGAICSGREFNEKEFIDFGENFGFLFQLTDDILDLYQDKRGSLNIVEIEGFEKVFNRIDEKYRNIIHFIERSSLNMGIVRGITELVVKRVQNIRETHNI
ncbi:MAG: polyprenyl synthetase family protein [Myxococcota bacterium]